jgi:hypothetical protein
VLKQPDCRPAVAKRKPPSGSKPSPPSPTSVLTPHSPPSSAIWQPSRAELEMLPRSLLAELMPRPSSEGVRRDGPGAVYACG